MHQFMHENTSTISYNSIVNLYYLFLQTLVCNFSNIFSSLTIIYKYYKKMLEILIEMH